MPLQSKKIMYVIGGLNRGGAETQLTMLASNLPELEYDVYIYVLEGGGVLEAQLTGSKIKLLSGTFNSSRSRPVRIAALVVAQLQLVYLVLKLRPDIMHAFLPLTNFMGAVAGWVGRVPRVITSRRALGTHQDRYPVWRRFDQVSARMSDVVTANSIAVRNDVTGREDVSEGKIRIIYNGIDTTRFNNDKFNKLAKRAELGISGESIVIVTVANLIPYKGHGDMLHALQIVKKTSSNFIALFVGEDRGIQENLEDLCGDMTIIDNVMFLGGRSDVHDLLMLSDIAVCPSHEEGFSNAVLEAMAAGLPIIATSVGGNPEMLDNGNAGVLVPVGDYTTMSSKILELMESPDDRQLLSEIARTRVSNEYDVKKMVDGYLDLYK